MTAIVRPRSNNVPGNQPLPPPSPAGDKPIDPIEIKTDSPLLKLLQLDNRTPSHILTLKAPADKEKKVTPVDIQKADQAYRQAEVHAKRGRIKEAYQALEKAYVLNPNDEKIAMALSEVLAIGGQALVAHGLMTEFLERHPESSNMRSGRINLSQALVGHIQSIAPQADEAERKELAEKAQFFLTLSAVDQAMIFYAEADQVREKLKSFENQGDKVHGADLATKASVLQNLQGQGQSLLELATLPALQGPEGAEIVKTLKALGTETTDAVIRFAEADSDPQVKEQVLPLKANKAMALGETEKALDLYQSYRESECKKLGGGDFDKGLSILREKFGKAEALGKENKLEEAAKELDGIPQGLLLAHDLLEKVQGEKTLRANLAACKVWRDEVTSTYEARRAKASDGAWDLLWGNQTDRQKVDVDETKETNLISEVQGRLRTGKNKTIIEALKDIYNTDPDPEMKESALLWIAKSGGSPFLSSPAGRLVSYVSSSSPSSEDGAKLLKDANELAGGDEDGKKTAALLYSAVALNSHDASQRDEARKAIK